MAKYITPIQTSETEILKAFKEHMKNTKTNTGAINFKYELSKPDIKNKPMVGFSTEAWLKIHTLVASVGTEIGWHGTVEREGLNFIINDIFVYPQTVTGATVVANEQDYVKWLQNFDDDTFNSIRLQGHSHVNFGVTPSGTDENFYNQLLQSLGKDEYYIFMIINKRNEMNIWIYDYTENIIYENKDIITTVLMEEGNISDWYEVQNKLITEQKFQSYGRVPTFPKETKSKRKKSTWQEDTFDEDDWEYDYHTGHYRLRGER